MRFAVQALVPRPAHHLWSRLVTIPKEVQVSACPHRQCPGFQVDMQELITSRRQSPFLGAAGHTVWGVSRQQRDHDIDPLPTRRGQRMMQQALVAGRFVECLALIREGQKDMLALPVSALAAYAQSRYPDGRMVAFRRTIAAVSILAARGASQG